MSKRMRGGNGQFYVFPDDATPAEMLEVVNAHDQQQRAEMAAKNKILIANNAKLSEEEKRSPAERSSAAYDQGARESWFWKNGPGRVITSFKALKDTVENHDVNNQQVEHNAAELVRGVGVSSLPFVPAAAAAAPVAVAGGYLMGQGGESLASAMGADPDTATLIGAGTGVMGGMAGSAASAPVKAGVTAGLRLARGPVANGLDIASAVLDNPIAGAASPRAPHVGRMVAAAADAIRPTVLNVGRPSAPGFESTAEAAARGPAPLPNNAAFAARDRIAFASDPTVPRRPQPSATPTPSPEVGRLVASPPPPRGPQSFADVLAQLREQSPHNDVELPPARTATVGGNPGEGAADMALRTELTRRSPENAAAVAELQQPPSPYVPDDSDAPLPTGDVREQPIAERPPLDDASQAILQQLLAREPGADAAMNFNARMGLEDPATVAANMNARAMESHRQSAAKKAAKGRRP